MPAALPPRRRQTRWRAPTSRSRLRLAADRSDRSCLPRSASARLRWWRSERFQDRAHDGAREIGGDSVEGVDVLLEERGGIVHAAAAGRLVLLAEHQARVLPQHFVLANIPQFNARRHRQRITRRDLLRAEAGRIDRRRADFADQHRVDTGLLRQDLVLAAPDEFRADLLRHQRLEVENRRPVDERRHADGLDVVRQKGAAARERVAAGRRERSTTEDTEDTEDEIPSRRCFHGLRLLRVLRGGEFAGRHCTTTLTSGPFATTTFLIVLPAVCPLTAASASARSRSSSSDASARTLTRARTLPLICTGTTTSSAFATTGSKVGHAALVSPSAWPSMCHSSSAVCGANGDSIRTSASTASRKAAMVCGRSTRPTGGSPRDGRPCAVPSLKS